MSTTTMITPIKLGVSKRSEIVIDHDFENNLAIITIWGIRYYADWKMFMMNNFQCPLRKCEVI